MLSAPVLRFASPEGGSGASRPPRTVRHREGMVFRELQKEPRHVFHRTSHQAGQRLVQRPIENAGIPRCRRNRAERRQENAGAAGLPRPLRQHRSRCRMGERGDIIKAMHHALRQEVSPHHVADYAIYEPDDKRSARLVGKVVTRGLSDELHDKHFLIVDGTDGRSHYVAIGSADRDEPTAEGSIVAITPYRPQSKSVDRTIAEIAATNDGHYSASLHLQTDIRASEEFIASHIRRLEALRRSGNIAERDVAGVWTIAPDHLEQIAFLEKRQARATPVIIERLSKWPVARQIEADGATWLDSELTSAAPIPLREAGFGREVNDALARRRQWLIARELARMDGDNIVYRAGLLKELTRREIVRAGAQLSSELGVPFAEMRQGDRVEGIYRRKVELVSGSFAVIQKSREFTLVPWRPVLERAIGQEVTGIPRGQTISWTFGRTRGPSIG